MTHFLRYATEKKAETVALIRVLAELETPSGGAGAINRFVDLLAEHTRDIATAETRALARAGNALKLKFNLPGKQKRGRILAVGHSDTVWPEGTLRTMPVREADGRLWGPGVLDMKAGIAFFVYAMRALCELEIETANDIALWIVPDEETGSEASRPLTEAEALQSDCVLVLEPGTGLSGTLKTARKGIGRFGLSIQGRAAHAGVDFPDGASAIVEAAHQVLALSKLTDLQRGTTVNPGVIHGGTRSNVIAAEARVEVDVRVNSLADAAAVESQIRSLQVHDPRCALRIEGGLNRPPMERTPQIAALFNQAQELGRQIGRQIAESSTGGGSDGNFTAALGIPTLDGLGAVGEGAHATNESILLDRVADRVALLAGLASAPKPLRVRE